MCVGVGPDAELSEAAGQLWWDQRPLLATDEISLPGAHNLANAMAVAAACLAFGVEPDAVAQGLRTFPGVAHRLESVARIDGVQYVNDSKATNVDSTIVALNSYRGGVHLIAGGRAKAQDFGPLVEPVAARCRAGVPDRRGVTGDRGRAGVHPGPAATLGRAGDRGRRRRASGPAGGDRAALAGMREL